MQDERWPSMTGDEYPYSVGWLSHALDGYHAQIEALLDFPCGKAEMIRSLTEIRDELAKEPESLRKMLERHRTAKPEPR